MAHLPRGCALWISVGGPLAQTGAEQALAWVDFRLQVLAWQRTKDGREGRNAPATPAPPPYAHEKAAEAAEEDNRRQKYLRRQQRRRRPAN